MGASMRETLMTFVSYPLFMYHSFLKIEMQRTKSFMF